ncbi:MAG: 1-deoxy-D-xylulose-5-phosphate synthase [Elusimicrobia bacterium]|nr:1-deoxy-D-xylulose-5-phosphate synthase [Elusimicrobiota bacterium]
MQPSMALLQMIKKPSDLRNLKPELLPDVAKEIRQKIIDVTAQTGGHLGASLGATDLAVALHYVFESPTDKIIWDTGHQAYAHKLLTGRWDKFHTLRQYGGISGFLNRSESEHDAFGAGHASTAISAALGFAAARDILKQDYKVVAVVNDGSITGGMAFEALQNAGNMASDLIVVLNDNQMFISHRVGAVGAFLAKFLTGGLYTRFEKRVRQFLTRLHFWGSHLLRLAKRIRVLLFPGLLFEEMGFSYLGPLDGHDLPKLIEVLQGVKTLKGPILLHVVTKKGRGYDKAENDPIKYHGVSKWNPETGEMAKAPEGPPSYTKVFGQSLCKLAKEDEKIVAITAAMPEGTGLDMFRDKFKGRYFDVGLGEQHAVTFAGGLACAGVKPVVAIYSTFLQRGFDQIEHDIALQKLPVVFCLDRGGLVGDDGATHHGVFDLSYLRMIPNMTIMAPKDENELQHMLKTALNHSGPVAIRYPRGAGVGVPLDSTFRLLPWGRGEILREGRDIAILGIGNMVMPSIESSENLAKEGINVKVINARFVKPLDRTWLLDSLNGVRSIITVEENAVAGGFGSAIRELLEGEPFEITSIGIPDKFIEHGSQAKLRSLVGLTQENIAETVRLIHSGSRPVPSSSSGKFLPN